MLGRLVVSAANSTTTVSLFSNPATRLYAGGLLCTAAGAWLTELTGSLLPLSLGSAALVMATVPVVRAIRSRHNKRRGRD